MRKTPPPPPPPAAAPDQSASAAVRAAPSGAPRPASAPASSARWRRADWFALVAVTLAAAVLRIGRVSDPHRLVFDETYYAKDACWYVHASRALCGVDGEQTQVHPPLGKWLIAAGIRAFGYDAFGWRIAAAVAGVATVSLLYVLGRRLLDSTMGAAIAATLLCFDFLHLVQSRIAMLDVFVALFGVAAVLFLVLDDARFSRGPPRDRGRKPRWGVARPWRLAAGIAAGAAAASKWSGVLVVAMVVVLGAAWEIGRDPGGDLRDRLRRAAGRAPGLLGALVIAPAAVYVASYVARLDGSVLGLPWHEGSWWRALWDRQLYMLDFHRHLEATHPYASRPWSWPLVKRPVSYYFETTSSGDYMEILALGNPLVWWTSLVAVAYTALLWWRARAPGRAETVVLAGFAFGYLPWFVLAGSRSAVFLFYLLPAVPFMCLAIAYVCVERAWTARARPALAVGLVALLASFTFYYPLLAKVPIPRRAWLRRIWVFDACDRPASKATASATASLAGDTSSGTQAPAEDVEPSGWCWI